MAPVDTTYYHIMGVSPSCTEAELKSAYRKKALQLHPDKGGDVAEFQKMKDVYDVLSDPRKRSNYDLYGPEGLRILEGNMESPADALILLSRSGRCCIIAVLLCISIAILSPIVLFSLKWDKSVSWDWAVAFIPLWVFHSVQLVFLAGVQTPPAPEDDSDWLTREIYNKRKRDVRVMKCSGIFMVVLLIILESFVALRLQGVVGWSWFAVISPLMLLELFFLVRRLLTARSAHVEAQVKAAIGTAALPPAPFACFLIQRLWLKMLQLIATMLLAARADKMFESSWFVCLIPLYIGGFTAILGACGRQLLLGAKQHVDLEHGQQTHPDAEKGTSVTGACCTVGFLLAIACTGASKLDGSNLSAFIVFLPCFILVFCCLFMTPACIVWILPQQPQQPSPQDAPGQQHSAHQQPQNAKATSQATDCASGPSTVGAVSQSESSTGFRPGDKVIIHGLTGDVTLNGREGTCKWFQHDTGRWAVELSSGETKALKPDNISTSAWAGDIELSKCT